MNCETKYTIPVIFAPAVWKKKKLYIWKYTNTPPSPPHPPYTPHKPSRTQKRPLVKRLYLKTAIKRGETQKYPFPIQLTHSQTNLLFLKVSFSTRSHIQEPLAVSCCCCSCSGPGSSPANIKHTKRIGEKNRCVLALLALYE